MAGSARPAPRRVPARLERGHVRSGVGRPTARLPAGKGGVITACGGQPPVGRHGGTSGRARGLVAGPDAEASVRARRQPRPGLCLGTWGMADNSGSLPLRCSPTTVFRWAGPRRCPHRTTCRERGAVPRPAPRGARDPGVPEHCLRASAGPTYCAAPLAGPSTQRPPPRPTSVSSSPTCSGGTTTCREGGTPAASAGRSLTRCSQQATLGPWSKSARRCASPAGSTRSATSVPCRSERCPRRSPLGMT